MDNSQNEITDGAITAEQLDDILNGEDGLVNYIDEQIGLALEAEY